MCDYTKCTHVVCPQCFRDLIVSMIIRLGASGESRTCNIGWGWGDLLVLGGK